MRRGAKHDLDRRLNAGHERPFTVTGALLSEPCPPRERVCRAERVVLSDIGEVRDRMFWMAARSQMVPPNPARSRSHALAAVSVVIGLTALACCIPSDEDYARVKAKQDAAAAEDALAAEAGPREVHAAREHLVAISAIAKAAGVPAEQACDAARVTKLRAGPPSGVDDTFWNFPWVAEREWLAAAARAGVSATPPPDPAMAVFLSLNPRLAFRQPSQDPGWATRDLVGWADAMRERPPVLALIYVVRFTAPALVWKGASFVDGSFTPGSLDATVQLWDIARQEPLCAAVVTASSSAHVKFGGVVIPTEGDEAVAEDFEAHVTVALNSAAERLSPGMKLAL